MDERKDFAKIVTDEDDNQVLLTVTYDSDEDEYVLEVAYKTLALGGCFMQTRMFFTDAEDAYKGFDSVETYEDVRGLIHE